MASAKQNFFFFFRWVLAGYCWVVLAGYCWVVMLKINI